MRDRSEKNVRETTLQTPRPVRKEGEEELKVLEKIPLQPTEKTMLKHFFPPASRGGPNAASGEYAWRKLQPVETPAWSQLLAGTLACGEDSMQEQVFWQGLWPMGDLH